MTLKSGAMADKKNQLCHHIYSNRTQLFYIVIIFHNITDFTLF